MRKKVTTMKKFKQNVERSLIILAVVIIATSIVFAAALIALLAVAAVACLAYKLYKEDKEEKKKKQEEQEENENE